MKHRSWNAIIARLIAAVFSVLIAPCAPAQTPDLFVAGFDPAQNYAGYVDEYTQSGTFVRHFVPSGSGGLGQTGNLRFGPDGNLYVTSVKGTPTTGSDAVKKYDGKTGAYLGDVISVGAGDLRFDDTGNMYLAVGSGTTVLKVDPYTGMVLRSYNLGFAAIALTLRPNGNLLVLGSADYHLDVFELDPNTGATSLFATLNHEPRGITTGPDGRYYVTEPLGVDGGPGPDNTIEVIGPSGGTAIPWSQGGTVGYYSVISNGTLFCSGTGPSPGSGVYRISAFDFATGQFESSFATGPAPIGIALGPTATMVTVTNTSGAIGQTITLSAALSRTSDNAPLPGRNLSFYVNNAYVGTPTTDSTGTAQVNYKVSDSFTPGALIIKVVRLANAQYSASTGYGTLNVSPADTSVTVSNTSGAIGQTVALSAVLTRTTDNAPLSGRNLSFYVGSTYLGIGVTDNTGTASINYKVPDSFSAGTQTITVKRFANAQYNASTGAGTLTVNAADTALAVANVSGKAGQNVTLSAVLTRTTDNAPLPSRSVSFYVNNVYVATVNTDSTGTASLSYTIPGNLSAGTQCTITVKRLANSQYNASQGTGTLTVTN